VIYSSLTLVFISHRFRERTT